MKEKFYILKDDIQSNLKRKFAPAPLASYLTGGWQMEDLVEVANVKHFILGEEDEDGKLIHKYSEKRLNDIASKWYAYRLGVDTDIEFGEGFIAWLRKQEINTL